MIGDVYVFASFAPDVVIIVSTFAIILRLFESTKYKPRIRTPFFVLFTRSTHSDRIPTVNEQFFELLSILKGSVFAVVEALDLPSAVLALLVVVVIFMVLRRMPDPSLTAYGTSFRFVLLK